MFDEIAKLYRKAEMGIIGNLSGALAEIPDETCFYDTGYMQSHVKKIQDELKTIREDMKNNMEYGSGSASDQKYRKELLDRREHLVFNLIFLASNSFSNLEDCLKMADGYTFSFMACVEGLLCFQRGEKDNAYKILSVYIKKHGDVKEHFLINKVYGLLLKDKQEYSNAEAYITNALQYIPDDEECLRALIECYKSTAEHKKAEVVYSVLELVKE